MLDSPICNLPLTTADNIGCHSNDVQVHQRQFSVHNMKKVKVYIMHARAQKKKEHNKDSLSYSHIHTHNVIITCTHQYTVEHFCHQSHIVQLVYKWTALMQSFCGTGVTIRSNLEFSVLLKGQSGAAEVKPLTLRLQIHSGIVLGLHSLRKTQHCNFYVSFILILFSTN